MLEYAVHDAVQDKYEKVLQLWIDNKWLLPYPKSEFSPSRGLIMLMTVVQENK